MKRGKMSMAEWNRTLFMREVTRKRDLENNPMNNPETVKKWLKRKLKTYRYHTKEARQNISIGVKKAFKNPETMRKLLSHLEEVNPKAVEAAHRPEVNEKRRKTFLETIRNDSTYSARMAESQIKAWENLPEEEKERRSRHLDNIQPLAKKRPSKWQVWGYQEVKQIYPDAVLEYRIIHGKKVFWLDVAIPSLMIDIEFDGRWHDAEKDEERDSILKTLGWRTIRIPYSNGKRKRKEGLEFALSNIKRRWFPLGGK